MTLQGKQLQLWIVTKARLRSTLLKNSRDQSVEPPLRKIIHERTSSIIDEYFAENSFLTVAFELFLNQLSQHKLKTPVFNRAVLGFDDLPDVVDFCAQLKERIQIDIDREVQQSLKPRKSSVSCSESDLSQTESYRESFDDIVFSSLDDASPTQLSGEQLHFDFCLATLEETINDWVTEQYSPVDERVLTNDTRRLRRMNSLSRLLSLRVTWSACTAVTLDHSVDTRLVIGANIDRQDSQETIFSSTCSKLRLIQQYLTDITSKNLKTIDGSTLDELAKELVSQLMSGGNTSLPERILWQAARKIIHAVCFDDETFTETEKRAFLNHAPATIILPKLAASGAMQMQVRHLGLVENVDSIFPLPTVPEGTSLKFIHAEQLIAYFLFEELRISPDTPLAFGINKLCCRTCYENLQQYPVVVHGHHNQSYQGVVNLYNGKRATESGTRSATTHPWNSPKNTPDRKKASSADALEDPIGIPFSSSKEAQAAPSTIDPTFVRPSERGLFSRPLRNMLPPPDLTDFDATIIDLQGRAIPGISKLTFTSSL